MNASNFYYGSCPKCNKASKLVIASWNELNYRFSLGDAIIEETSHTVSLSIYCNECKRASSGMIQYEYDGPDMGPLSHYADSAGNISELLGDVLRNILYDVQPLRANSSLLAEAQKSVDQG